MKELSSTGGIVGCRGGEGTEAEELNKIFRKDGEPLTGNLMMTRRTGTNTF